MWGPAHLISAFWFEGYNGILTKCIHGSKEQGKELVNTIQLIQGILILKARSQSVTTRTRDLSTRLLNKVKRIRFDANQQALFSNCNIVQPVSAYYRASINREIFTSKNYRRQEKRNNYTVCYSNISGDKLYGEILYFCESSSDKIALVKQFVIEHTRMFIHDDSHFAINHIIPVRESDTTVIVPLENILFKVIRAGSFVCIRPNKLEVNL